MRNPVAASFSTVYDSGQQCNERVLFVHVYTWNLVVRKSA